MGCNCCICPAFIVQLQNCTAHVRVLGAGSCHTGAASNNSAHASVFVMCVALLDVLGIVRMSVMPFNSSPSFGLLPSCVRTDVV